MPAGGRLGRLPAARGETMWRWVVALGLLGCEPSVRGAWSGTWTSGSGLSGAVEADLKGGGDHVSGTFTFTSSPCFSAAEVDAVLVDDALSGSATAGAIRVDFAATLLDDRLDGTYAAVSAGFCTGDVGTFDLER